MKKKKGRVIAHTYLRGASIPSHVVNQRISVFNGNQFSSFIVRRMMIGRKFGEFSLTKRIGKAIHVNKRKKKGKGTEKNINKKK